MAGPISAAISAWATQPRSSRGYRSDGDRVTGKIVSDLTGPGREPQTFRTNSNVLTTELTGRFFVGLL